MGFRVVPDTTECKLCEELTYNTGTCLCDGCWELERNFASLASAHPEVAKDWLWTRLAELDEKG